jgi:nucleoside-triphosphatase
MPRELHRILLTGPPGCGKTTAVMKIVGALSEAKVAGFYTEEIRESGRRKGFRWHRLDSRSGTLAHVDVKSRYRVSKYGVDIESFDREAVPAIDPEITKADLFAVDEIGKMECSRRSSCKPYAGFLLRTYASLLRSRSRAA